MASMESTAMTEIVMNMFIFFFISFSLLYTFNPAKTKQIKVNLPKAKNVVDPQKSAGALTVSLSSEGPMYLDGKVVSYKELESQLAAGVRKNPEVSVVLEVDRLVPFKNVVRVLDMVNGLNVRSLRISAEEEK
jgi:biopolymer transport protein ExbD